MAKLTIDLEESYDAMLRSLKPVAEAVLEEPIEFDTYANMVIWRGIRGMIEDILPKDSDILTASIGAMHEQNPEFVAAFIIHMLTAGQAREGVKERLGFIKGERE